MSGEQDGMYFSHDLSVPETPRPGTPPEPWKQTQVVGTRRPRVDAYDRVSGAAVYTSDVDLPGMLHAGILRSPHAHAEVTRMDVSAAERLPGVHAALSYASPEADLSWPWSRTMAGKLFDTHLRFEGDPVAAVAAETPYQVRDALAAIRVDYRIQPHQSDFLTALEPDAPRVHEEGNEVQTHRYGRGDVEAGFAAADVVLEQTFSTPCELHTPLEPHGCVAKWDGDSLTLWESTQGVFAVQERVATVLGLPMSKVRVIGHYVGGGFGSKLTAGKYTIIAALLARRTARPVKLVLSRPETFLAVGNRPPNRIRLKAGVKKDGTLTALEMVASGTGGAFPAGGTGLLDWLVKDLYRCDNVRSELTDVFIHAGPARPFRAPGHPQCAWALEQMIDALAERIDMDPLELRLRNVPQHSQGRDGQPPYSRNGLGDCLQRGAEAFGWKASRDRPRDAGPLKRGVGVAAGSWQFGAGGPPSTVVVKLFADGSVNLNLGASDIGTGTKSIMAMVVSEELGIKPELIQIEHADTGTTQFATPSGGSKTVPTESPAVRQAAIDVRRQLVTLAADQLRARPAQVSLRGGRLVTRKGEALPITEVEGLRRRRVLVGTGYRGPNPTSLAVQPFVAQFCEVEVDTRTGRVRIVRFLAAHDSGRVMNRTTFDCQVHGGVTMGIGFGLTEERVLDHGQTGKMLNCNWHDYRLPLATDTPLEVVSVPIDAPDRAANATGAKGLGEPVTIPTAAALANAVFHATGVQMIDAPMTPGRVVERLTGSGRG